MFSRLLNDGRPAIRYLLCDFPLGIFRYKIRIRGNRHATSEREHVALLTDFVGILLVNTHCCEVVLAKDSMSKGDPPAPDEGRQDGFGAWETRKLSGIRPNA